MPPFSPPTGDHPIGSIGGLGDLVADARDSTTFFSKEAIEAIASPRPEDHRTGLLEADAKDSTVFFADAKPSARTVPEDHAVF